MPHDQLIPAAEEIAHLIIANAPLAVRFGKEAVKRGLEMTLDEGLIVEGDLSVNPGQHGGRQGRPAGLYGKAYTAVAGAMTP